MNVLTTANQLAEIAHPVLVPTMGALHAGHASLIARAAKWAKSAGRPVLVSIFVNPTQFGPSEDFSRYPRPLEADLELASNAGAHGVFAPSVEVMYPPNTKIAAPPLPPVATQPGLEDARRPGHFAGVTQVVARLFDLTHPSMAIFGEKDYQQLQVLRAMVEQVGRDEPDRWSPMARAETLSEVPTTVARASRPCSDTANPFPPSPVIQSAPTIREPDGLAMSSRNAYLSETERRRALGLFCALTAAQNASDPANAEAIMRDHLEAHQLDIEYAVARDAATLMPIQSFAEQPTRPRRRPRIRLLIAARCGSTRLIDNMAYQPT